MEVCGCRWYVLGVCIGGVWVVCVIGGYWWLGEFRRGVEEYSWLVGKPITPPCVWRKSIPSTTGKRIFLATISCTRNVSSLITMDMNVLPNAIRGLWSAPEIENSMHCSGGTEESQYYNCSSKRLMEEPVSIKIMMGLLSKLPYRRHCQSSKAWFWITLLSFLCWPGILDLLAYTYCQFYQQMGIVVSMRD